jgi:hypothetical protein
MFKYKLTYKDRREFVKWRRASGIYKTEKRVLDILLILGFVALFLPVIFSNVYGDAETQREVEEGLFIVIFIVIALNFIFYFGAKNKASSRKTMKEDDMDVFL